MGFLRTSVFLSGFFLTERGCAMDGAELIRYSFNFTRYFGLVVKISNAERGARDYSFTKLARLDEIPCGRVP